MAMPLAMQFQTSSLSQEDAVSHLWVRKKSSVSTFRALRSGGCPRITVFFVPDQQGGDVDARDGLFVIKGIGSKQRTVVIDGSPVQGSPPNRHTHLPMAFRRNDRPVRLDRGSLPSLVTLSRVGRRAGQPVVGLD